MLLAPPTAHDPLTTGARESLLYTRMAAVLSHGDELLDSLVVAVR